MEERRCWHGAGSRINDPFLHRYFRYLLGLIACFTGREYARRTCHFRPRRVSTSRPSDVCPHVESRLCRFQRTGAKTLAGCPSAGLTKPRVSFSTVLARILPTGHADLSRMTQLFAKRMTHNKCFALQKRPTTKNSLEILGR